MLLVAERESCHIRDGTGFAKARFDRAEEFSSDGLV
jgi:hypothetical protein